MRRTPEDDPREDGEPDGPSRFLANLGNQREAGARLGLWCEALCAATPEDAALLMDLGARRARVSPQGLAAYLPLLDYPLLLSRVGGPTLEAILDAARRENLSAALLYLEHPESADAASRDDHELPPDPKLETLTLGHRRTLARGMRSHVLARLLKDPDPRVVRELLQNPRLRQEEVVAIASRRPCAERIFWDLAASPGWIARLAVRRAAAMNPYAPARLAAALLVTLPDPDLRELEKMKKLHPRVREGASFVRSWRREG